MNIVLVSHCDYSGQSAYHVHSIASELHKRGHACLVLVPNHSSLAWDHSRPAFPVRPYAWALKHGCLFPDGTGPDILHCWTPREHVRQFVEQVVSRYACPYIVHLEDNEQEILNRELGPERIRLMPRLPHVVQDALIPDIRTHPRRGPAFLRGASALSALLDSLLELAAVPVPGKVFWPGFEEQFQDFQGDKSALRRHYGIDPDATVIFYSGNFHGVNEWEARQLLLAVTLLRRQGRNILLLKTGRNDLSEAMSAAFAKESLHDLGFVPRKILPELHCLSDILVQPGTDDLFNAYRFPSKLPEYFVSGKPVILPCSNIGQHVRDRHEALLLHSGTFEETAQRIAELMDDPALCARIGAGGRRFALEHLRWDLAADVVEALYAMVREAPVSPARPTVPATPAPPSPVKLLAYYLPQFHPIPENDEWWGVGFTEWTNVKKAVPNYAGHRQPAVPEGLGYYDLRDVGVMHKQAALAKEFGLYGFCFYYYWFNGRRVLETPLDNWLQFGPDFPFCICWANENWTRRWDGQDHDVLLHQDYTPGFEDQWMDDVLPLLSDTRYIRVDGAPMLLVYRIDKIPNPRATAERWRAICKERGLGRIHLVAVQSFGLEDPRRYGFDAAVQFPPHNTHYLLDPRKVPGVDPQFTGYLEDQIAVAADYLARPEPEYPVYQGVMPAWDNTPRIGRRAHIDLHASPALYETWLKSSVGKALRASAKQAPFVFINAWNEWAEGAYLEPDTANGRAYLAATRRALVAGMLAGLEKMPAGATQRLADRQTQTAHKSHAVLSKAELRRIFAKRRSFVPEALSYATSRDYCDTHDTMPGLANLNGDLKDVQRAWILKTLLNILPPRSRVLEIGAGEPWVADILTRLGHEAWVVDPYDGTGNGPVELARYKAECPHIHFIQKFFGPEMPELGDLLFDCIYSISVIEHIPVAHLPGVFDGIRRFLAPTGHSLHAVDFVRRGLDADEHMEVLRVINAQSGHTDKELEGKLLAMDADLETYYLSVEAHNRWRLCMNLPYDKYPMRKVVSIHYCTPADHLLLTARSRRDRNETALSMP